MKNIIYSIVAGLILFLAIYFGLPTIGFTPSLIFSIIAAFAIPGICDIWSRLDYEEGSVIGLISTIVEGLAIVVLIIVGLISLFAWEDLKVAMTKVDKTEAEAIVDLPTIENIEGISLMDTASAKKIGDRIVGSETDIISQFELPTYYTQVVNGEIKKIAPFEYGSFFKAMNNDYAPGYVIVDTSSNEAEIIRCEIVVAPSDVFSNDLNRVVWNALPNEYRGEYSFQVDDEGNPYWVVTLLKPVHVWGGKVPYAIAVVDACTGIVTKYEGEEIPTWVDQVYSGDMVSKMYNWYGNYINGFWNLSQKGETITTDDFGYVCKDNTLYVYTGVTAKSSEESNLGFILANTRTGEVSYYPVSGAEEYSAMSAAEGIVQNYGYEASFPSLVYVGSEPTYVTALKDANGLVKQYGMVSLKNYTVVAVGDTIAEATKEYRKALTNAGTASNVVNTEDIIETSITIDEVTFIVVDGNTVTYIESNGKIYKSSFVEEDLLLNVGDSYTVKYDKSEEDSLVIENLN